MKCNKNQIWSLKTAMLLLLTSGLVLGATGSATGSVTTKYQPTRAEKTIQRIVGADYGCVVADRGSRTTVKVTSSSAKRKLRRYIERRGIKGLKLSRIEIVPHRFALSNVLQAWIDVLSSMPVNGNEIYQASVGVDRPVTSVPRSECPHISISLASWPEHQITSATQQWAIALSAKYPGVVKVSEHLLSEMPARTL